MNDRLRRSPAAGLRICILLLFLASPPALADPWKFENVDRVVAFGDVHGAYNALVTTLKNADIIDDELHWSGGKTHLVSTGDLLDRGAESRRVMDLMMRLEQEAPLAGGRVHQLLGNHEVMNLIGDLRYVTDEEFAAFQDMESAAEREAWFRRYLADEPESSDEASVRRSFDKKARPGFFGHRKALRPDGFYGKWLLSHPFVIVINDVAFVHGGLPPLVAEQGLAGTNVSLKEDLRSFIEASTSLQDMKVLNPLHNFREIPVVIEERAAAGQLTSDAMTAALTLVESGQSPLFGASGPTWYRGNATCSELVEGDALDIALKAVGATRVVIGHTTTGTLQVQQRMSGRVIEIDTGMLNDVYGGSGNALLIENGELTTMGQDGTLRPAPVEPPLRVGDASLEISDSELVDILANGQIVDVAAAGAAWRLVRVGLGDTAVHAVFRTLSDEADFVPELAAYRLDRLLGLGMIPATVRREVEGEDGTLQFVPKLALTERERVAAGRRVDPACALDKQRDAMFVFDALIYNNSRSPSTMLFDPGNWQLMLVNHESAFGTTAELPGHLADLELVVGEQWRAALRLLDDEVLRRELGNILSDTRLQALGLRRDTLIARGH